MAWITPMTRLNCALRRCESLTVVTPEVDAGDAVVSVVERIPWCSMMPRILPA